MKEKTLLFLFNPCRTVFRPGDRVMGILFFLLFSLFSFFLSVSYFGLRFFRYSFVRISTFPDVKFRYTLYTLSVHPIDRLEDTIPPSVSYQLTAYRVIALSPRTPKIGFSHIYYVILHICGFSDLCRRFSTPRGSDSGCPDVLTLQ